METNLFGEEVPTQVLPAKRGPTPHQQMLRVYGQKRGYTCRDCKHLTALRRNATYYKCTKFGVTASAATDWRAKYAACGLWVVVAEALEIYDRLNPPGGRSNP